MERLNFNHLYYFYVVAKEGSIKAAAERLHVSQPTISDQIKLLEEYFRCQLFERRNRSLFLSNEGKEALDYAEKIFELGQEVTTRLRHRMDLPKQSLDIGLTHAIGDYFLFDTLLPLFQQKELSINVKEDQRHLLLAELEEGNLDMIFTDHTEGVSSLLNTYRIGVSRTYALAHKKFKKYKRQFPQNLSDIPFFHYTKESLLHYEIDLFFSRNALTPQVIGEANETDLFQMVTEKGLAFTIVPEVAKKRFCQNSDIIVLGELKELQTSVFGIVQKSYTGAGLQILRNAHAK